MIGETICIFLHRKCFYAGMAIFSKPCCPSHIVIYSQGVVPKFCPEGESKYRNYTTNESRKSSHYITSWLNIYHNILASDSMSVHSNVHERTPLLGDRSGQETISIVSEVPPDTEFPASRDEAQGHIESIQRQHDEYVGVPWIEGMVVK